MHKARKQGNHMKKLLFFLFLVSTKVVAQSPRLAFRNTLEIEIDPIAYTLKGYSFHAIYNHNHFRYDAGFFGLENPAIFTGNTGFTTKTTGFGVKADYMFKRTNGVYAGLDAGYLSNGITEKETGKSNASKSIVVGTHIGYRLFLFPGKSNALSGLYLSPWTSLGYNYTYEKSGFNTYKEKPVAVFATVHVGYRF
jgi:hypothetical protein